MSGSDLPATEVGRETFGTACGLAVVVGALAVLQPTFDTLTAALVALAFAAWASTRRRTSDRAVRPGASLGPHAVAFAMFGTGVGLFLYPPDPVMPWRALLLALGVVPLWLVERVGPGAVGRVREGRSG